MLKIITTKPETRKAEKTQEERYESFKSLFEGSWMGYCVAAVKMIRIKEPEGVLRVVDPAMRVWSRFRVHAVFSRGMYSCS